MTQGDKCRLDMLIRVRNFGASHGHLFPDTSRAHAAFTIIGTEVDRLEALHVTVRSAKQAAGASRKQAARRALAGTLTRAGSTARVLARTTPALDVQVGMPLPSGDLPLLNAARHFLAGAAPFAEAFAADGIPIAQVEDRIARFEQALHERETGLDARVQARTEIEASFARAMAAVAVLDVNVANGLADPPARAVWKHHRRLMYPRRRAAPAPEQKVPEGNHDAPASIAG